MCLISRLWYSPRQQRTRAVLSRNQTRWWEAVVSLGSPAKQNHSRKILHTCRPGWLLGLPKIFRTGDVLELVAFVNTKACLSFLYTLDMFLALVGFVVSCC